MMLEAAQIAGSLMVGASFVALIAWVGVILLVNPVLDPLFYNDKYFDWFLQRAHPFFFSFRAMWYSGAVTSRWLAKKTMGIDEDSFRMRVGIIGRMCCWILTGGIFSVPFLAAAYFILDLIST